jgi:hypothetical protein
VRSRPAKPLDGGRETRRIRPVPSNHAQTERAVGKATWEGDDGPTGATNAAFLAAAAVVIQPAAACSRYGRGGQRIWRYVRLTTRLVSGRRLLSSVYASLYGAGFNVMALGKLGLILLVSSLLPAISYLCGLDHTRHSSGNLTQAHLTHR